MSSQKDTGCIACYGILHYNAALKAAGLPPACYGLKTKDASNIQLPKLDPRCDSMFLIGKGLYSPSQIKTGSKPVMVVGVELIGMKGDLGSDKNARSSVEGMKSRSGAQVPTGPSISSAMPSLQERTDHPPGSTPPALPPPVDVRAKLEKFPAKFVKSAERQIDAIDRIVRQTADKLPQKMLINGTKAATATWKNLELCAGFVYNKIFGSK